MTSPTPQSQGGDELGPDAFRSRAVVCPQCRSEGPFWVTLFMETSAEGAVEFVDEISQSAHWLRPATRWTELEPRESSTLECTECYEKFEVYFTIS